MNMTACFINLMTNDIFPEPEGPPTILVNGCFHLIPPRTGLTLDHYTVCVHSCCTYL